MGGGLFLVWVLCYDVGIFDLVGVGFVGVVVCLVTCWCFEWMCFSLEVLVWFSFAAVVL